MKRYIPIIICVLICAILFGCSAKSEEIVPSVEGTTATTNHQVSTSTKSGSRIEELTDADGKLVMNVVDEEGNTVTEKMMLVTAENGEPICNDKGQFLVESDYGEQFFVDEPTATTQQTSKTTAKKKESTTKKAGSTSKTTAKNKTTAAKKTTAKTTVKTTAKPTEKQYITLKITAKTADKVILDSYSVTVESHYSVLKALKQACKDNNIEVVEKQSIGGASVTEIDGIEGSWTYSINGGKVQYNVALQKLKSGDSIVFTLA